MINSLKKPFTLGHVSGIPVRADARWIFVFVVISLIIAGGILATAGNWTVSLVFGFTATFIFFLSVFVHEFAHAAVAKTERLRVVEIVLHPFGGLTRFVHEPETPRAEFRIAIAGPVASLILAIAFGGGAAGAFSSGLNVLGQILVTLSIGNFLIALFNMFPGYPLDGGRVLRAYLWHNGRDLNEATLLTGRCGQIIAGLIMFAGISIAVLTKDLFTGAWAFLAGVFLYDSAAAIIAELTEMSKVKVDDAMLLPPSVRSDISIQEFVDHILPRERQPIFVVADERQMYGMLLLNEAKRVEPSQWRTTLIRDVMRPVDEHQFVETGSLLINARELANSNRIGAVGVIDAEGRLVGIVYGKNR